jgi:NADPH-dependent curcumin reductase CurA
MTIARSIRLAARPKGPATLKDLSLTEDPIPVPGPGQFLVRVIWLSLDPYMRGRMDDAKSYAKPVEIGEIMQGGCVGEVLASHHPHYAHREIVTGAFGWTTHAVSDGEGVRKLDPRLAPVSTALGVLGMPGITAWVGLNDIAAAQPGETIVVSAATGAVGGLVGQLAKAKGMTVIGLAGGADKCAYACEALGYDYCLDHRAAPDARTLGARIEEVAPQGVDVYFENVGGKSLSAVLPRMNVHGRVALCGMIAWYGGQNLEEALPLPLVWRTVLTRRLGVQGFIIFDHFHRFPEFLKEVGPMVADGRIVVREDVTDGIENAPAAFLRMLEGGNFGKTLVRVGPDP